MTLSNQTGRMIRRRVVGKIFKYCCLLATLLCVVVLTILLVVIVYRGASWLNWNFVSSFPSRFPERAGVKSAIAGSLLLVALTTLFSVPIGVATAVYLEEYASDHWWNRLVKTNIANLAGVPSIVFGILGLGVFVRFFSLGQCVLAGAMTMSLVVLPIIIITSQEALRAVPNSLRHASYALGASRAQTVWRQVLPSSLPGIMTGVILSLSRALGEAAPLIAMGALAYVAFLPTKLNDPFTALPIQIFNWSSRPQHEFQNLAAAGIMVLLAMLFCMNGVAVFIRHRYSSQV